MERMKAQSAVVSSVAALLRLMSVFSTLHWDFLSISRIHWAPLVIAKVPWESLVCLYSMP